MKNYLIILMFILVSVTSFSQTKITGTVTDNFNFPLLGASIQIKDATKGTVTDENGAFEIETSEGQVLEISYIGYKTTEITPKDSKPLVIVLESDSQLSEVILVGSRNPKRTLMESAVPVDVIDVATIAAKTGKVEVTEMLQFAAPSFNAQKQSGADGADHITPATLRGLGPDQTLVLINGKRRHQSSLINLFGTRGRGNTGTDLNAIPATAIKRIEVLRDGASAQYGSDAIAGVINIVLKDDSEVLSGEVFYGANNSNPDEFLQNLKKLDGNTTKVTMNYGSSIGDNGGFVNVTGEYFDKEKTFRPGASFRSKFGEASLNSFQGFFNAEIPTNKTSTFYAFGGYGIKNTDAFAFDRGAIDKRNVVTIYPNGFTPRITSIIKDQSISSGFKTMFNNWNVDFNNTFGKNDFHYFIKGTLNSTLLAASPVEFDAGGHTLSQNTTSIDFTRNFNDVLEGFNVAFGTEYRTETFTIFAGEEKSYASYDVNGVPVDINTPETDKPKGPNGDVRPGGSQGFPGYSLDNELEESRNNVSLYIDGELDITESALIAAAARYERYSDFGSTITGKLSTRIKLEENFNLRGSVSTGFRAPSLAQLYYNLSFSDFDGGELKQTLLSANNSQITKSFGIGALKQEESKSASLGFTFDGVKGLTVSLDGYYTEVDNRIVLTSNFEITDPSLGVEQARFFVNGVDTQTYGLDFVASYNTRIEAHKLGVNLIGNINKLKIESVNGGGLDEDVVFGANERAFLQYSAPAFKTTIGVDYGYQKFSANAVGTIFGKVGPFISNDDGSEYTYGETFTLDLSASYKLTKNLKFTLGSNNFLNSYPDKQIAAGTESFGAYDATQQGFGGAFYYTRLNYTF